MTIRDIPRTAVGGSIKVVRLPLDIAVALMPGNGSGPGASAAIVLDRLEAQVRDLAGAALGDDVLREDAALRRVAADERERALRLRATAARRAQEADERLEETHEQAQERREEAAERAKRQRAAAAAQRNERKAQAAAAERKRRATSAKAKAKTAEVIEEQATDARLEQLERETEALDEKEAALTAEAEVQRLQDAATARKAARKKR
jgi:colicin import membrane protein